MTDSATALKWQLKTHNPQIVETLEHDLNISKILATLLANRGHTELDLANRFLNAKPDQIHAPHLLKDIEPAVTRIVAAIKGKQKICIYGDYDVDGAVSTSLFIWFFREINFPIEFYIPNRVTEGYSLNVEALKKLKARGVDLVITVDNGIMALKEVLAAREMGLDIVVTDHHQVGDTLPEAVAVVNPQRKDCTYPFKGICGAGVVFKILIALRQRLRDDGFFADKPEPNLKNHLDLLAIATVCDMVPLKDENRYFVQEGLLQLSKTKKPGIKALMNVSGVKGVPTATDLGFRLGPRINACGRLEDASIGVKLLTSENFNEALDAAQVLNNLNQERRDIETEINDAARAKVLTQVDLNHELGLVLFDESWHEGVVGIVASRVVEQFKRPVFVMTRAENGMIKGSGRSINGVSLIAALRECAPLLFKYGGHEAAAGATLEASNLESFRQMFDVAIKKQITLKDLNQTLWVDQVLNTNDITFDLAHDIARLEPFGMANAKPVFVAQNLTVTDKRIVGMKHLKLNLDAGGRRIDAIAFGKANLLDQISGETGLIFGLEINEYNNQQKLQLMVSHFI